MSYLDQIERLGCSAGVWLRGEEHQTLAAAWTASRRGDWMLQLVGRLAGAAGSDARRPLVLAACECARVTLPLVTARFPSDPRPLQVLETAERWARGEGGVRLNDVRRAHEDLSVDCDVEVKVTTEQSFGQSTHLNIATAATSAIRAAAAAAFVEHGEFQENEITTYNYFSSWRLEEDLRFEACLVAGERGQFGLEPWHQAETADLRAGRGAAALATAFFVAFNSEDFAALHTEQASRVLADVVRAADYRFSNTTIVARADDADRAPLLQYADIVRRHYPEPPSIERGWHPL